MSLSSRIVAFNSKSAGKDKVYRTVQYGCKLIWYILWKYKTNKEYIEVLKKIESTLSGVRKVMRLGKSHDHIESILSLKPIDDYVLRNLIKLTNLNQALYMVLDNLLWFNSMGLVNLSHKQAKLNVISNKFWLLSSFLYLVRDAYELRNVIANEQVKLNSQDKYILNEHGAYTPSIFHSTSSLSTKKLLLKLAYLLRLICSNKRNHPLLIDTVKNLFDVCLPLASLNYINLSPGMQGFCGLIASLLSLLVVWDSNYKLIP